MAKMSIAQLAAFGAEAGSISEITHREATGDRSVTLDRFDKDVLFRRIGEGNFARKGGAMPNGIPDAHHFLVLPHDALNGAKKRPVIVVHPKSLGNELRLYGSSDSGLDLRHRDYFYIFVRKGEPLPFIGTISPTALGHLGKMSGLRATAVRLSVDDEQEDAAYQQAIDDIAARLPVAFKGERYPRDPARALNALRKAGYSCEAAPAGAQHNTFTSSASGKPYVEAHHLVPLSRQSSFTNSLDVEENIVALCPLCHRRLHHGTPRELIDPLLALYEARKSGLEKRAIRLGDSELLEFYGVGNDVVLEHFAHLAGKHT